MKSNGVAPHPSSRMRMQWRRRLLHRCRTTNTFSCRTKPYRWRYSTLDVRQRYGIYDVPLPSPLHICRNYYAPNTICASNDIMSILRTIMNVSITRSPSWIWPIFIDGKRYVNVLMKFSGFKCWELDKFPVNVWKVAEIVQIICKNVDKESKMLIKFL